jgi:very-short-patch-repair endonuclease
VSVLDTLIARLAGRQHGVVALWQLSALGIEASAVRKRVADGRLKRVHRGVYAVGQLDRRGHWMAAVLACGEGAVLSHRSAAMLWDLRGTNRKAVDVTAPGARRRSRPRITVHGAALHSNDRAEVDDIPVTSVPRTLLDLAEVVAPTQLRRAYEAAERHQALDFKALKDLIARSKGRRGLPALLALLDYDPLVDAYAAARLVVELQSYEHHAHRQAFDRDYAKLGMLTMAGYTVLPLTDRQLKGDSDWVVSSLRGLLHDRAPVIERSRSAVPVPTL